jgi:prevent-host-death family protein
VQSRKIINVHQAKAEFSALLDRAHAGHEVVISKKGKPWAKLVPVDKIVKRPLGFVVARVTDAFFEPLPEEELRGWE